MDAYDPFLACISLSSVSYYFCMTSLSRKEEWDIIWEESDYFLGRIMFCHPCYSRKGMAVKHLIHPLFFILWCCGYASCSQQKNLWSSWSCFSGKEMVLPDMISHHFPVLIFIYRSFTYAISSLWCYRFYGVCLFHSVFYQTDTGWKMPIWSRMISEFLRICDDSDFICLKDRFAYNVYSPPRESSLFCTS